MVEKLERKLAEAGYKLLGEKEIEDIIVAILEKKDTRLLKAIPYLIYLHRPDISRIYARTIQKKLLGEIVAITRKIFLQEKIVDIKLPKIDKNIMTLDAEEFHGEFVLQRKRSQPPSLLYEKEKIYAERNLQMWLSRIFTRKEKQIINRILYEKPISKTEYEYYSRKTKKKLTAIVNLQDLAKSIIPLSPSVDEDLFELKRYFEAWAEREGKKWFIATRFFVTETMLSFTVKGKHEEEHTFVMPLSRIKDKRYRELIEKYEEHDFM